jgi:hypothetical protein
MGGLALKHIEGIRRYKADEFYALAEELIPRISKCLGTEAHLVKSYHLKESFGDMDIIVLNNGNLGNIKEKIQNEFQPKDMHFNGNVWSFDFADLQIDIILTPTSNWETSKVFFAYNDLGNLMGKIYHKFGLKYGYDGLKYIYRLDNDRKLGDITVTKNMKKAFEFLGLSYEQFERGFDTIEDIFNFVVGSPYFQKEAFYFENLNAINKKRNKRRANYKLFIEFVNGTGTYEGRNSLPDKPFTFESDKTKYFDLINEFFPESDFLNQMEALRKKEQRKKAIHDKFNGDLIMKRYPDLKGKNLGFAMGTFSCRYTDFDAYILSTEPEKIWSDFESTLKTLAI